MCGFIVRLVLTVKIFPPLFFHSQRWIILKLSLTEDVLTTV